MKILNARPLSPNRATADSDPADGARWDAVLRRDKDADGTFVYAVKSTGVFCRPSGPARPARRHNVSFYASPAAAAAAGFRACKRCVPDGDSPLARRAALVAHACARIHSQGERVSLAELAREAALSPAHFHRLFKEHTGLTPKQYELAGRKERVAAGLAGAATITDAIYEAGFGSSSRFYENAGALLGMTPRSYRAGGRGEVIRCAVAPCPLGAIVVAATERGICAIEFGDAGEDLTERVRRRFPKAELRTTDAAFQAWVDAILAYIEQPRGLLDLPLDVRGTAFQRIVWQALRDIPPGMRASYADIAQRIGRPTAVRAVAQACASNRVAVAVPCHRVVRSNGDLSGYRWGADRKAELLRRESKK